MRILDNLPVAKLQAQLPIALDNLPVENSLTSHAKDYILSCRVEGKSDSTIAIYTIVLSRFLKYLGANDRPEASDIRLFILSLQQKLKPHSVHVYYRSLKTWFNWLADEGIMKRTKHPMVHIKPPKLPELVMKPFTNSDLDHILYVIKGDRFVRVRSRAMILILYDTGIRLAELAGIQLEDVSLERETIKVRGKGNKERRLRIGRVTQRALLRYVKMRDDDYPGLWVTEERRPITKFGVATILRRIVLRSEVSPGKFGPHRFRHTAAITMLRNGMDVFNVKNTLGHTKLETTQKYLTSLSEDDAIEAHKKYSPADTLLGDARKPTF